MRLEQRDLLEKKAEQMNDEQKLQLVSEVMALCAELEIRLRELSMTYWASRISTLSRHAREERDKIVKHKWSMEPK